MNNKERLLNSKESLEHYVVQCQEFLLRQVQDDVSDANSFFLAAARARNEMTFALSQLASIRKLLGEETLTKEEEETLLDLTDAKNSDLSDNTTNQTHPTPVSYTHLTLPTILLV